MSAIELVRCVQCQSLGYKEGMWHTYYNGSPLCRSCRSEIGHDEKGGCSLCSSSPLLDYERIYQTSQRRSLRITDSSTPAVTSS